MNVISMVETAFCRAFFTYVSNDSVSMQCEIFTSQILNGINELFVHNLKTDDRNGRTTARNKFLAVICRNMYLLLTAFQGGYHAYAYASKLIQTDVIILKL